MTNRRNLGLWRSEQRPDLPDPATLIDSAWSGSEKGDVEYYLSSWSLGRAYMGYSECRICGKQNRAREFTDGTYVWPEGLLHYVVSHNVRLPDEFVVHALARRREIDEGARDERWWLASSVRLSRLLHNLPEGQTSAIDVRRRARGSRLWKWNRARGTGA